MRIKPILIIAGDPESVFYEIFLKSLKNNKFKSPIILIGSIRILKFFQKKLNFNKKITLLDIEKLSTYKLNNSSINLIDVKLSKSDKDSKIYLKKSFDLSIKILNSGLKSNFKLKHPTFKVLGLNPHAGEDGKIGKEELLKINPAIKICKKMGIKVSYAISADTAFNRDQLDQTDAYLAMYHDQALPVLKALSFGKAVNITLGTPIIRTSVDHGTALEIAGRIKPNLGSIKEAIKLKNIEKELFSLKSTLKETIPDLSKIQFQIDSLKSINLELWEIENGKRLAEKNKDFGKKFIELARSVYKSNDKRSKIKLEINNILGSNIKEVKSHY